VTNLSSHPTKTVALWRLSLQHSAKEMLYQNNPGHPFCLWHCHCFSGVAQMGREVGGKFGVSQRKQALRRMVLGKIIPKRPRAAPFSKMPVSGKTESVQPASVHVRVLIRELARFRSAGAGA
jgi:hypothetical protein